MKRVWFNHGMDLIADVLDVIKEVGDPDLRLVASHARSSATSIVADEFHHEPDGLVDGKYVDWCLGFAKQHNIDLFVPSRTSGLISGELDRFHESGIRVLIPGRLPVMKAIQHKTQLYQLLGDGVAAIPEWRIVNDLAGFEQAYAELRQRHKRVCFKPASGVFAHGFRVVAESGSAYQRLMKSGPYTATSEIGLAEARLVFGEKASFEDLVVLQYLPGRERSVDCLAHDGRLVTCITRFKETHSSQLIEKNPVIEEAINGIVGKLQLTGIFNVQFKDGEDGVPYLLEINSRMSGGLKKACTAANMALPYWAVRLALGTARVGDVPKPAVGGRLVKVKSYEIQPGVVAD